MIPLLVGISFMVSAQFNKGDKFIGGTLQFRSSKQTPGNFSGETIKSSSASFMPYVGFLLGSHLAVGGGVGFSTAHSSLSVYMNPTFSSDNKKRIISGDVFVKRFFSLSDKFLFSLKGDVMYSAVWEKYSDNAGRSTDNTGNVNAMITPSFIFLPKPKWGIEARIGGLTATLIGSNGYNVDLNFNTFSFGVNYFFRK